MFKLDMQALRNAAMVTTVNNPPLAEIATVATLAISQPPQGFANDLLDTRLMVAAMRRCDQFNDSEAARQAMRDQLLEVPPHLRQDLLDHFLGKPPNLH
jgi:hypothetical protein